MVWDFDSLIDRNHTDSIKYDFLMKYIGRTDLFPMWVADMDFRAPGPIITALQARVTHGIFGYTGLSLDYINSVRQWHERRQGWKISPEWIVFTPGVVPALNFIIQKFTKPGDEVIVQNPVYYPFFDAIQKNNRRILYNPLQIVDGKYRMDFDHLKRQTRRHRAKILILCNPHNPVGRCWTVEELRQLGEICLRNKILVVADEIHSDLIYPGYIHHPFPTLCEEFAQHSITCTSVSKTFNLAGLQLSNIIIPNSTIRQQFQTILDQTGIIGPNVFATIAARAAYDECEPWLIALLQYVQENYNWLRTYLQQELPDAYVFDLEGTYLVWIDFRKIEPNPLKLKYLVQDIAKLALDEGTIFGPGGEGFERINIACPRILLKDAMQRLVTAIKNR